MSRFFTTLAALGSASGVWCAGHLTGAGADHGCWTLVAVGLAFTVLNGIAAGWYAMEAVFGPPKK